MSLSPSGELTGTPVTVGTVSFTVHVTDAATPVDSSSKKCKLVVSP